MNTETQNSPKRTAQEIAEQHRADRKRYRASPEGKKASAEAALLMAIAKADDEIIMKLTDKKTEVWEQGDEEMFDLLTGLDERADKDRRNMIAAERVAAKIAADAEAQCQRADRAEAGQTPRGVEFDETSLADKPDGHEFAPEDFCDALKWGKARVGAIRGALRSWGKGTKRGIRWALTRDEAKRFWNHYRIVRHEKPHPPRGKKKIVRE